MDNISTENYFSLSKEIDAAIFNGLKMYRRQLPLKLTAHDRQYLLEISRQAINYFMANRYEFHRNDLIDPPHHLLTDIKNVIFVSICKKDRTLACVYQPAGNIIEATLKSVLRALKIVVQTHKITADEIHIEIAILFNKKILKNFCIDDCDKSIILGMHAISLSYEHKAAIFKNSVPISRGFSTKETIYELGKKLRINLEEINKNHMQVAIYDVLEFREDILYDHNQYGLYDLYRNSSVILQSEVTRESLLKSVKLASSYLNSSILPNGEVVYLYSQIDDDKIICDKPISVIRNIASMWALAESSCFLKNNVYYESASKVIECFMLKFYRYDLGKKIGYLEIDDKVDIGTAGLLLLSLNSLNRIKTDLIRQKKMDQLVQFIFHSFDGNKKKLRPIYKPNDILFFHESELFFPGIALTALAYTFSESPNDQTIKITYSVFSYYRDLFFQREDNLKMAVWLSTAYAELFRITRKLEYANFVFEINDTILPRQIPSTCLYPDLIGGFSSNGNIFTTAVFTESLLEGYRTAFLLKDYDRLESYKKSILMSLRVILQSQYRLDNTFNPNCLGGFRNSFNDNNIRIDSAQHCILAILKALKYLVD